MKTIGIVIIMMGVIGYIRNRDRIRTMTNLYKFRDILVNPEGDLLPKK